MSQNFRVLRVTPLGRVAVEEDGQAGTASWSSAMACGSARSPATAAVSVMRLGDEFRGDWRYLATSYRAVRLWTPLVPAAQDGSRRASGWLQMDV